MNVIKQEVRVNTGLAFPKVFHDDDDFLDNMKYAMDQATGAKMEEREASELDDIFNSSSPSDYISFDPSTKEVLDSYLKDVLNGIINIPSDSIPSDIFKANTISIPDMLFKMSVWNDDYTIHTSDMYIRFVYAKDHFIIGVQNSNGSYGAITTTISDDDVTINKDVVYTKHGNDSFYIRQSYKNAVKLLSYAMAKYMLGYWYIIQIMMLNPAMKDRLFVKGSKEKLRCNNEHITGVIQKKRKTKYVKYKELNTIMLSSDSVRKQHTMCWYVIGHYRQYKSGLKTFVHGYWKGPLRELQKNLDDGRERIVG